MKKGLLVFLLMLAAVVLGACGGDSGTSEETGNEGDSPESAEAEKDAEEYVLGAIYSKTGPNSPLGEPEWNTTEMLVEQINEEGGINGVPLRVVLADDESSQEKAVQEINRLINDENVLAVLGSSGTTESLAMKGVAMQNEVPMISAAAAAQVVEPVEDSKWIFKTPQSDRLAVERIYMYLNDENISKVGLLTDSNAFGTTGLEQLENLSGEYNIEITAKESYNTQDPDMSTQLTNINSSGAEALIVWGTNPGPAIIASNLDSLGFDMPFIGSHGIANQKFIELAGEGAEGVVIPTGKALFPDQIPEGDTQYDVLNTYYEDYVATFDSEPTNFGSYGYDNLMLAVEALKNGATDRASIRDYLENEISNWVGTTGVFNLSSEDHNGLEADSLVVATVKDGEWVLMEDN
ncbi:ABC transporter substrate-binding protein [Bacillus piscicola]|uniref:ABC transporter substrate-binding protein n=1 Tax=Bacillus piscicola TaxID=1632684 RepID=UPI001F09CB11|nr:ABC transporter substrate-binding protein [Bacillus piscicola]